MAEKRVEIVCSACAADTFLRREPEYEGFKKVGEKLSCASCGHGFACEEDVPFKEKRVPKIFSDEDKPKKVELFASDEKGRNCRHCRHYVVNPFIQRCGKHHREVQATNVCDDFEREAEVDQAANDRDNADG